MEKRVYKNRERTFRGPLSSFKKLPEDKQQIFIHLANVIREILSEEAKVYVFGSFYWGFWDESSDYDVIVDYSSVKKPMAEIAKGIIKAHEVLNKEMGVKVDIVTINQNTGILIP